MSNNTGNKTDNLRACPICKSIDATIIFSLNYSLPSNYNMDSKQDIFVCDNCGFVFNGEEDGYKNLETHAKENNRYEGVKEAFYGYAVEYIKNNIGKDATILDVGCGPGFLLSQLQTEGYQNLYGLDPSEYCVGHLRENGVTGVCGSVYDDLTEFKHKFDAIVFTNVIEHIENPSGAIRNMKLWVKDDGILYIAAPNPLNYHLDHTHLSALYCAEHINHFSQYHLDFLLDQNGFVNIFNFNDSTYYIQSVYKANSKRDEIKNSCLLAYKNILLQKDIVVDKLKQYEGKKIAVWGMSHQFMSMYPDAFSSCKVEYIIDSDKSKHNLLIDNIKVCAPSVLESFDGPIVVLNNSFRNSILKSIQQHNFKHEIISFPDDIV